MLCDEVGLGKTIEAGLVIKEYLMRQMAERILILTPPGLVQQWREELAQNLACAILSPTPTKPSAPPATMPGRSSPRHRLHRRRPAYRQPRHHHQSYL
ncbi:MAG: hypothetical protein IPF56_23825 [Chloroflexi bacterium]|nr:hypothetical protein [Chloroflexota bacterium]